jgi:hypothetical protein
LGYLTIADQSALDDLTHQILSHETTQTHLAKRDTPRTRSQENLKMVRHYSYAMFHRGKFRVEDAKRCRTMSKFLLHQKLKPKVKIFPANGTRRESAGPVPRIPA